MEFELQFKIFRSGNKIYLVLTQFILHQQKQLKAKKQIKAKTVPNALQIFSKHIYKTTYIEEIDFY